MFKGITGRVPLGPLHKVNRFLKDPVLTQEKLLRNLLRTASKTEWGKRYEFESLLQEKDLLEAFRSRVPMHNYQDFKADVNRIRDGAEDIIWPGAFRYFAASSGTTSEGRIIPISLDMLKCNKSFSFATALNYLNVYGKSGFLFGKHLTLPGWIEDDRRPGTRIAQISAILTEYSAASVKYWSAIDNSLGFIENWEEKMSKIADHVIKEDIRLIAIAPSWGQVLCREVIRHYNIKHPNNQVRTVGEIWPNLQVVMTGGVALSGYIEILRSQIGLEDVDFVETYGASEGFFSFQNDLADEAMLLHLDNGVYIEFVKSEEIFEDNPHRYLLSEVEVGVAYSPIVSNNSGLWAYNLGDIIEFSSLSPHKIKVVGRTTEMLDKYGEAVFGNEARTALNEACRITGAVALEYHVTHIDPGLTETPAHDWLIEFEKEPEDLSRFIEILDEKLKDAGHHYCDRREGMAFDKPRVKSIPLGSFYRWMQSSGKRVTVQSKVPRMKEERDMADAILAML